jgi:hypothetical protein
MINHKGIVKSIQEQDPLSCGFCRPAIHSRQACALLNKIASLKKGRSVCAFITSFVSTILSIQIDLVEMF